MKKSKLCRLIAIVLFVFAGVSFLCSIGGFILLDIQSDTLCAFLLVMSILEFIIAIVLYKKYKEILKTNANFEKALEASKQFLAERKAIYLHWLNANGFVCSKQIGSLLLDFTHKKWCSLYSHALFEFSDIISVECHKTKRQQHEGGGSNSRNSMGYGYRSSKFSSSFGASYGNRQYSSSTQDTSTYDVHIKTSRLNAPLIVFSCDTSYDLANEITSMIQLIIDSPNIQLNNAGMEQIQLDDALFENDIAVKKFMEKSLFWAAGQLSDDDFKQEREILLHLDIS